MSKAKDIISRATVRKRCANWYTRLSPADKKTVDEVVTMLRDSSDAIPLYRVAETIIEDLNLTVSSETVARTLKELIRHGKK